jgi:ubiquinone/menaquinone biosynthesis C-methylase UbiE
MKHTEEIVDQFTRQAAQFAQSQTAKNQDILNQIIRMAEPGPADTMLDVACGPGLLVCAFARQVQHATGIDLTPAMLEQASQLQRKERLDNISWAQGDVTALPWADESFDIVTCRFAFHHFPEPSAVLKEMRRVCRAGGRIVVADSSPTMAKADAFNAMEKMRDPSHTRALPVEELRGLFGDAGLPEPQAERFRLALDLESFLERSYPRQGDEARIRALFEDALTDDHLDLEPRRSEGKILFSVPGAVLAARVPHE